MKRKTGTTASGGDRRDVSTSRFCPSPVQYTSYAARTGEKETLASTSGSTVGRADSPTEETGVISQSMQSSSSMGNVTGTTERRTTASASHGSNVSIEQSGLSADLTTDVCNRCSSSGRLADAGRASSRASAIRESHEISRSKSPGHGDRRSHSRSRAYRNSSPQSRRLPATRCSTESKRRSKRSRRSRHHRSSSSERYSKRYSDLSGRYKCRHASYPECQS